MPEIYPLFSIASANSSINISKTVDAANIQVEAIEYIESKSGISSLPENLQKLAYLRLENPEASLAELAAMCEPPISKSGFNHRMKKLEALRCTK